MLWSLLTRLVGNNSIALSNGQRGGELIPNINVTESSKEDNRSILLLKTMLPDNLVDCRQLQEGGTLPNIDGYLDILCPDGTAREKVVVQVKHLTYKEKNGSVFYDIPQSIYAYAERHKGELVIFIACDYESRRFYWRNINAASIEDFKNKSARIQTKARYYFQDGEKCSENSVEATIKLWRELYKQKMDSIKDDRILADRFAAQQRIRLNSVYSDIHGISDSHIVRCQVDEIMQWISKDTGENENRICLLVGDAGVGKSVVLKDLISLHQSADIKYLCIKADSIDDNGNPVTLEKILDTLAYYSAEVEKVVLVVDQIDALSQALTNDRKYLNMMMALLSSLGDWPNVRAVVSCRKYDLEYDSALNTLKTQAAIIEIGELTNEEVAIALNKLEEGLDKRVDGVTIKLLRTVQMLDSFAILFHRNRSLINFNTKIELYDAIWEAVICDSPCPDDVETRVALMYKITETIRMAGTLNPQFAPVSDQQRAYDYLASNGIIRRAGRTVSFFHQSFYEYTLARHYTEQGGVFARDIKNEIQGLEIRSTVKAVLDFKRGHDIAQFVEEARSIFIDPDIRLHLKLLTLSVLAFVDKLSRGERSLVTEICRTDERLLEHFLRGVSSPCWLPTIRKILNETMPDLRRDDTLFFPIISCLSRYAFGEPRKVYAMLDKMQDAEARLFGVAYVLREHNDYRCSRVLKAYAEAKSHNTFFAADLIQDAIMTNIQFALAEAENLLLDYLISGGSCNKYNKYELVEMLCGKLYTEYPAEMLGILHRCICKTIRITSQNSCIFSTTKTFDWSSAKDDVRKLLTMYEELLMRYSSDDPQMRSIVVELLSLNNETLLSMAFVAMAAAPNRYDDVIRSLLDTNEKIGGYLHGYVEFFFLKMLRAWYDTLDENAAEWYQRLLLSYKSEYDFRYDSERKYSLLLCPHLWRHKWTLICNTLSEDSMIPEMKKCFRELMRRFGTRSHVKRSDYLPPAAVCCGGVVGNDIYERWPIANWLSSFLKLNKWRDGRKPISLRAHADAFKRCVSSNPRKFYSFVSDISLRDDIQDMYKIAGLEGLLAGGVDPDSLWDLAKKYITEDFARNDSYSFGRIAEYYIKDENVHIDTIMTLCKMIVLAPVVESHDTFVVNEVNRDLSSISHDLLTMGVNSYHGHAARLLIYMCVIPARRPMIYGFFTDNANLMHESVKAVLLHYLNVKDYFDAELYFPMMKTLLFGLGTEALYIQPNLIQWCFYHRNDVVSSYINRIESDISSHELLAQIYFYGMAGQNNPEDCEMRLERILALGDEVVVAKVVEVAMKLYERAEYRDLCIRFLERYAFDARMKVVEAYCWHCDYLPVEAFNWYCSLSKAWTVNKHREIDNQLEYVKKCISDYPVQCYRFISSQKYFEFEDFRLVYDEIVNVLLEIYKKLRLEEDEDAMNEILDLFDEYIYRGNRVLQDAVSLLS